MSTVAEMQNAFARRFRTLRKTRLLKQQEVSEALEVSKGAVAMWECGKRTPSLKKLQEIAEYFNCSLAYLTGESDDADAPYDAAAGEDTVRAMVAGWTMDPKEFSLKQKFDAYLALDDYGRKAVNALMDAELERCKAQRTLRPTDNVDVVVKITCSPSDIPTNEEEERYLTNVLLGANK